MAEPADLWETHATWWQDGFTEGADPEYVEQILPLATDLLAGYPRVLDVGTGEGQIARLLVAGGAELNFHVPYGSSGTDEQDYLPVLNIISWSAMRVACSSSERKRELSAVISTEMVSSVVTWAISLCGRGNVGKAPHQRIEILP